MLLTSHKLVKGRDICLGSQLRGYSLLWKKDMVAGAALFTMVGVWGDRTSHGVGEKAETERNPSLQIPGSLDPMS